MLADKSILDACKQFKNSINIGFLECLTNRVLWFEENFTTAKTEQV